MPLFKLKQVLRAALTPPSSNKIYSFPILSFIWCQGNRPMVDIKVVLNVSSA